MTARASGPSRRHFLAGLGCAGMAGLARPALARPGPLAGSAAKSWPDVAALVDRYVVAGRLAGAVAALGIGQGEPEVIARGYRTMGLAGAVDAESLFRVYSMTKPITGMAAMMLIDEGRMKLDQPLADILPLFADLKVQRVPDGPLDDVVPLDRPVTIRHLLTHTSGLGYSVIQKGEIARAYERAGLLPGVVTRFRIPGFVFPETVRGLSAFADRLAGLPLVYQPGTRWSYSVGLDLMGRVIEVVSGQEFAHFLQDRMFRPLGMDSTFFQVPAAEQSRLTTNYAVIDDLLVPLDPAQHSIFADPPAFPFGGAGLVSSPRDYDRFLQMLLGLGRLGSVRVMSEGAVRLATSNLLPEGISTQGTMARGGGFGAGGRVGLGREEGTFGWGGAAGTIALADLKRGWRGGFYAQYMPSEALAVQRAFPEAAMKDAVMAVGRGK